MIFKYNHKAGTKACIPLAAGGLAGLLVGTIPVFGGLALAAGAIGAYIARKKNVEKENEEISNYFSNANNGDLLEISTGIKGYINRSIKVKLPKKGIFGDNHKINFSENSHDIKNALEIYLNSPGNFNKKAFVEKQDDGKYKLKIKDGSHFINDPFEIGKFGIIFDP